MQHGTPFPEHLSHREDVPSPAETFLERGRDVRSPWRTGLALWTPRRRVKGFPGLLIGLRGPSLSVHVGAVDPVADLDAVLLASRPHHDHLQVVVGHGGLQRPEEPLRGPQRQNLPLDVDDGLGGCRPGNLMADSAPMSGCGRLPVSRGLRSSPRAGESPEARAETPRKKRFRASAVETGVSNGRPILRKTGELQRAKWPFSSS